MFRRFIITLIILSCANIAYATNYYSFLYRVEDGDTFALILKKFVKDFSIINAKTPMVKKTIRMNPKVKKWDHLPTGTVVELFISDDFMDLDKYRPYQEKFVEKLAAEEEQKNRPKYPEGHKGSIFYMASLGMFTQKADNVAEINFRQNSPISIGASFSYYPKNKLYSFSYSAYYSYLMASANTLTSDTISIPPEIGTNVYGEYRFQKYNFTLYAGPDFERFSTFNLKGLQNDKKIYVDNVTALYWTVGFAKLFTFFNKPFFTKLSLSKSILTGYKNNAPVSQIDASDYDDNGKYNGYKFMCYLNYKITDKFYVHTLLKYHSMTGPSELSTFRIGVGVGYILF